MAVFEICLVIVNRWSFIGNNNEAFYKRSLKPNGQCQTSDNRVKPHPAAVTIRSEGHNFDFVFSKS